MSLLPQPPRPIGDDNYSFCSNQSSTIQSLEQRSKYKDFITRQAFPATVSQYNFWGRDKFLGRVNLKGETVVPRTARLKQLVGGASPVPAFALNFVADAWRDFRDKIIEMEAQGVFCENSPYLKPQAKKAYRSPTSAYHLYLLETIYPMFVGDYLRVRKSRGSEILNFGGFLDHFQQYSSTIIKEGVPLTFHSYLISSSCSVLNTGLAIEISDASHDDDFAKCKRFLYDGNFDMVCRVASWYGFVIDRNAPWRFVADIGSKPMREYMLGVPMESPLADSTNSELECDDWESNNPNQPEPYGYSAIPGLENIVRHAAGYPGYQASLMTHSPALDVYGKIFQVAYAPVWSEDMDILKIYLMQFYNSYVEAQPSVSIPPKIRSELLKGKCVDTNAASNQRRVRREQVSLDDSGQITSPSARYGDKWSLYAYYKLRSEENQKEKPERLMKKEFRSVMSVYYKTVGNADYKYLTALRYLNGEVFEPFDTEKLTFF